MPAETNPGGPRVLHCEDDRSTPLQLASSVSKPLPKTSNSPEAAQYYPGQYVQRLCECRATAKQRIAARRLRRSRRTSETSEACQEEEVPETTGISERIEDDRLLLPRATSPCSPSERTKPTRVLPQLREREPSSPCSLELRCEHNPSTGSPRRVKDEESCPIEQRILRSRGSSVSSQEVASRRRCRESPSSSHSYTCSQEHGSPWTSNCPCSRNASPSASPAFEELPERSFSSPEGTNLLKRGSSRGHDRSGARVPKVGCSFSISSQRRHRAKDYSYFHLALLLLLLAFGHSGLLRPSVNPYNAKTGTGLSVFLTVTVFGGVNAAPVDLTGDAGIRAERSANLSHITGSSRKIQMIIKNRYLQILPDGTVNGSNDGTSDYTILQRISVSIGQLKIQGVATCLYLCMDSCGLLYGSRDYTEDCVFNETMEDHNYNTYSSTRWSTAKKTLYAGLNRRGQPRRVQAKGHNLGRLSTYARVMTGGISDARVEAVQSKLLGARHNVRHHHGLQQAPCPILPPLERDGMDRFRCRKRKKRKKEKRKCKEAETPGTQCVLPEHSFREAGSSEGTPQSKRSCEGAACDEASRKQALNTPSKKRKSRIEAANDEEAAIVNGKKSPNKQKKNNKPNGMHGKKKGPMLKRNSPHQGARNRGPGRVTRTTAPEESALMTSPLSWYPGASTTPSPESAALSPKKRRTQSASSSGPGFKGRRAKMASRRRGSLPTTPIPPDLPGIPVDSELQESHPVSSTPNVPLGVHSRLPAEETSHVESLSDDDPPPVPSYPFQNIPPEKYTTPIVLTLAKSLPARDAIRPSRPETRRFPTERLAM